MPWRSRWLVLGTVLLAYVGWAAVRSSSQPRLGFVLLVVLLLAHGYAWIQAPPAENREHRLDEGARTWVRACFWSTALVAVCQLGSRTSWSLLAGTIVGATTAATAALTLLGRLPSSGGLLARHTRPGRTDPGVLCAVVGVLSAAAPLGNAASRMGPRIDAATTHALATAGGLTQLLVLLGLTHAWARRRSLEIGVSERLRAAWQLALGVVLLTTPAALLAPVGSEACVAAGGCVIAALCLCACATIADPARVRVAQRALTMVVVVGSPLAIVLASVSFQDPDAAPPATALGLALGVAVGLIAMPLARRSADAESARWSEAVRHATAAAQRLDPDEAVISALTALRELNQTSSASPELWRVDPPELLTVDRAGYPHRTAGVRPPEKLAEFAQLEPERTLQTAVLESVEVRHADVRDVAKWLRDRDGFSITVVDDGQAVLGLLVLPAISRHTPLALEEARSLRILADRLASILSASSALARSRARELETRGKFDQMQQRCHELQGEVDIRRGRHELVAQRAARAALVAKYSHAGREALERLRELGRSGGHVALEAPPGIDPVPSAAVLHLSGPRRTGPFVVVHAEDLPDCVAATRATATEDTVTSTDAGHEGASAPEAPLALAAGGSLVVLDAAALSHGQQDAMLAALDQMSRQPGLAPTLVVCLPRSAERLADEAAFTSAFADRLRDRAAHIPRLADRPEDLRGVLLDRVARVGLRLRGRPFGLTAAALEQLIEHAWPGNDLEIDDVLTRAALESSGDCITVAALRRVGFAVIAPRTNDAPAT